MPEKRVKSKESRVKKKAVRDQAGGVVRKRRAAEPVVRRTESGTRLLQVPKRYWYKPWTWRNHPPVPRYRPLPKARKLFWASLQLLWQHKKLFGGIIVIYGLLNILFVRGLSGSSDLSSLKSTLDSVFHGGFGGKLASSATSFVYLLGTSGSGNTATSGVYQSMLLIVCSLAFIWALRQALAKHAVRIRDSFYQGMYPLVPFLLLFLVIGLQLLPLAIGGGLYSTVISNGIAVHAYEKAFWLLLFIALALWSLRMITSSVFAVYIVTLPDMTPLKALRSSKQLVYGRRLLIWRKLIFLPIILLILAALIEFPLIMFVTSLAAWVFFALSMIALAVVHAYLYNLYRELL